MNLLELVDSLTAKGKDAPALLVQCEKDWAAVAVKPNGVLLVLVDAKDGAPWEAIVERACAVTKTERPEVLQGLLPGVMAVALIDAPHDLAEAPTRIEAMGRDVRWFVVGDGRMQSDKRRAHQQLVGAVEKALFHAAHDPRDAPVPSTQRRGTEARGEAALAAEAKFRAAQTTQRYPPATTAILAACIAVFLLELAWDATGSTIGLARMGGVSGRRVAAGHYEALLASGLLHAGVMHIGMNGLALMSLGRVLEKTIGAWRLVLVFTVSVLGGSIAAAVFKPDVLGVGASGGIFGIMTCILGLTLRRGGELPELARQRLRQALVSSLVFNLALSLMPGISLLAHAGGGVTGFLLGVSGLASAGVEVPWLPRPRTEAVDRLNARYRAAGVTCALLLVMSVAVAFAKGHPWDFGPATARTREIPGTRWSVQIPENLAAQEPSPGVVRYGVLREDPLIVEINSSPSEAQSETFLRERVKEHLKRLEMDANVQVDVGAGADVARARAKAKNGVEYAVWVFWADGRIVDVEALLTPAAPSAWRQAFDAIGPLAPDQSGYFFVQPSSALASATTRGSPFGIG
jgi:membrane associated rhomboid family serine protease